MNGYLDGFARAYQQGLLRSAQGNQPGRPGSSKIEAHLASIEIREHLLSRLGSVLISLGEHMKGQDPCAELSHGRA
jgi:hypothetical protein